MIDCVLEMTVDIVHFDLQALSTPPSMLQVYSRMPQVANQSYAKAAQLRLSGAVIILTTPACELAPNRVPCGPDRTSIRETSAA